MDPENPDTTIPDPTDSWNHLSGRKLRLAVGKRILFLLLPVALAFLMFLFFWFVYPPQPGNLFSPEYLVFVALMIAYIFPPFGKESIIPAAVIGGEAVSSMIANITNIPATAVGGFPLWTVIVGIVALDLIVSMFISLNFDLLLKIPVIGPWFRWIMRGADKVLRKKKWIEDLSSAGLLIFMYIPLQGSGAMTTSIIARILNYTPLQTMGLVTFGSILSCLTVGFGITSIVQLWAINPALAILEIFAILAVIILIAFFWSKLIRRLTQHANRRRERKQNRE